tara:strand:+ start:1172 stop:1483 length:312 start_codon:yes stop_codon:yes gene_type:complete
MKKRNNDPTGNYQKSMSGKFGPRVITADSPSPEGEYYAAIVCFTAGNVSCKSKKDPKDESIDQREIGGQGVITSLAMVNKDILLGSYTEVTVSGSGVLIGYLI